MTLTVLAPLAGRVLPMEDVPDPVFAASVVGPGIAIDPACVPTDAVSPVTGRLVKLHPHAFVVLTESGAGVLVHLGIDTVQLKGEGFTVKVEEGVHVEAGQPIVRWDPAMIEAGGRSPVCPVVALDATRQALAELASPGPVDVGAPLFRWAT